ncbi:NAD-dependent epimerase/dehydratase family protein [Cohnella thailandensis]|uniref:SDR family oxidoreductase n=1 Tax=Cohnella thailandensis TaxID=557557 RepID=A0A841SY26_9BACL|nr:SDR family oxidoreductase [Cohnella thailandensis]MBB6635115.1 SDR family oxidoreductase [Cohnella thailandensis]MBP1974419.1 nucleoside-diphosphate-sugar epimerase [Cohnella thailandensis]
MAKTVLVTGAGGYIGSVLVPKLLNKGYHVKAIDRFFFGTDKLSSHGNLTLIKEDCRRLTEEHFEDVDAVIDLVAISNDPSGELFQEATYQINHLARANCARLAKQAGVRRYILPSSCSIYGFQDNGVIVDELSPTNPLTTYAKANEQAERDILPLADATFTAVVIRQATVYGYSPRMRFDLAINGMTLGAWEKGDIPLMRDGTQWRPMVHVQDTTDVMCLLLEAEETAINGQIFNVGSDRNNYQLGQLAEEIAEALPIDVTISWYGDPDHRSYRVNFEKIEKTLNWKAKWTAADGALEIYDKLVTGGLVKNEQTITLGWYQELSKWHKIIKECEMYGGIISVG